MRSLLACMRWRTILRRSLFTRQASSCNRAGYLSTDTVGLRASCGRLLQGLRASNGWGEEDDGYEPQYEYRALHAGLQGGPVPPSNDAQTYSDPANVPEPRLGIVAFTSAWPRRSASLSWQSKYAT